MGKQKVFILLILIIGAAFIISYFSGDLTGNIAVSYNIERSFGSLCVDGDNGIEPFEESGLFLDGKIFFDKCKDSRYLREHYCDSGQHKRKLVDCLGYPSSGACLFGRGMCSYCNNNLICESNLGEHNDWCPDCGYSDHVIYFDDSNKELLHTYADEQQGWATETIVANAGGCNAMVKDDVGRLHLVYCDENNYLFYKYYDENGWSQRKPINDDVGSDIDITVRLHPNHPDGSYYDVPLDGYFDIPAIAH